MNEADAYREEWIKQLRALPYGEKYRWIEHRVNGLIVEVSAERNGVKVTAKSWPTLLAALRLGPNKDAPTS